MRLVRRTSKKSAPAAPSTETIQRQLDVPVLETAAELLLEAFFKPFRLDKLADDVHMLVGAGFSSIESLRGLDDAPLKEVGITGDDAEKVLLASWLHSVGLDEHGEELCENGVNTLLKLQALSDVGMKRAGVRTIGHRRMLQRYLREDERIQERLDRAEAIAAEAAGAMQRGLHAINPAVARNKRRDSNAAAAAASRAAENAPIRFEPLGASAKEPWAKHADPGGIASLPVGSSGSIHAWSQPWATTYNAALFGTAPGLRAEAHSEACAPEHGTSLQLVSNDGKVLHVW